MNSKVFYLLVLPVLALVGYGIGAWQDSAEVWDQDEKILKGQKIIPRSLPDILQTPSDRTTDQSTKGEGEAAAIFAFESMTDSGVDFVYRNGPDDQFHLAETLGGGVAATDFDRDGDDDLIFVNGGDPVTWPECTDTQIAIFRRQPSRFADQTSASGLNWTGYGHGCAVSDINNDGFDDLLVTGYQHSALYLNQGDGTFTQSFAVSDATADHWCATAGIGDLDRDGDADIYITCYTQTPRTLPTPLCTSGDTRIHCHPHHYDAVSDLILENTGDGGFQNRSADSGIGDFSEYGLGVTIADLDRNGTMEIFIANDGDRNLLFQQSDSWKYTEIANAAGVAFNGMGESMGSMGIACADFDRNGWQDILTTNFAFERNVLFSNLGGLSFVDNSERSSLPTASRLKVGWSAIALDANQDGWNDLFVANGHVTEMPSAPYAQPADFFGGSPDGLQWLSPGGDYFNQSWHGRGAARTDLNGDGRDDLVVSHIDAPASLLLNKSRAEGNVLALQLCGIESARSANGALLEIEIGDETLATPNIRNAGYLSSNSEVLRIGVGRTEAVEQLTITWPCGTKQVLTNLPTGKVLTVIEGQSMAW